MRTIILVRPECRVSIRIDVTLPPKEAETKDAAAKASIIEQALLVAAMQAISDVK